MLELAADALQRDADRPLKIGALKKALSHLRPASYEAMGQYLEWITQHVRILSLWRDVFPGVELPGKGTWSLQCEFVWKVCREKFPADIDYMDSLVNSGEPPFYHPIMIEGIGVPWELCELDDIHPLDRLMVDYFMPILSNRYIEDREVWLEELAAWEEENDILRPPFLCRCDEQGIRELKAKIRQAPAPLCFLADLIDAVRKDTGNMFFDLPNSWMQFEYNEQESVHYWVSDDVLELAEHFAPVAEGYHGIQKLYEWWNKKDLAKETAKAIAEVDAILYPLLSTPHDPQTARQGHA